MKDDTSLDVMADWPVGVRRCPAASSLEILGERWSLLAIREMGYGVHRFSQIAGFTGASRDILADRLRTLESAGVVEKRQYSEHPPRFEYHLTQAGREVFPVIMSLLQWGEKWTTTDAAPTFRHDCGHTLEFDQVCRGCGEPITRGTLTSSRSKA